MILLNSWLTVNQLVYSYVKLRYNVTKLSPQEVAREGVLAKADKDLRSQGGETRK